jgi:hypothetical protein
MIPLGPRLAGRRAIRFPRSGARWATQQTDWQRTVSASLKMAACSRLNPFTSLPNIDKEHRDRALFPLDAHLTIRFVADIG